MRTRRAILACAFIAIVALAIYATSSVLTPTWVFELITDKASYSLGENVQIIVTLENHGFISHSITATADPVVVAVYELKANPTNQRKHDQLDQTSGGPSDIFFLICSKSPFQL